MASVGSRPRGPKASRLDRNTVRNRARSHSFEHLETRAYLAAVSITGPAEVNETAGTAQVVVSLSEKVAAPVTVNYSLQSTIASATYGRDYRLSMGRTQLKPTGSLTFKAGQTSQVITMNILNDDLREGDERITFALQAARNATLNPAARNLSVTIKDNDNYTLSVVGPATVAPGTTNEYRLHLSSPATRRETFYVSTRGSTARIPQDYYSLTRVPVTILPGQTSALVRVVTLPNATDDYDRILFLDVVPATPGFPAPAPFQITIPGVLGPVPPTVTSADATAVNEGAPGQTTTANFVVSLSFASTLPITIDYATADGTATVGDSDYTATSGTLTFAPGETSKIVSVSVIGDNRPESNETFQLVLSNATNAAIVGSTATGTIVNDDESAYKINVVFPDNSLTTAQKNVFLVAAARWSAIIVADVPDQAYQGRLIDDLEIKATAPYIDGPYGILGQAGPTAVRTGSLIPYLGEMEFDSADVAMMVSDGSFAAVIMHEMGHVLGIGTLWEDKNLVSGIGTSNPIYVGANAVREYQTLSGTAATSVPVENTGGPGTAGGHWRESVFTTELMTGYAEPAGVTMPISRLTVGTLHDLGYTVDYAAADPFSLGLRRSSNQAAVSAMASRSMLLTSGNSGFASLFAAAISGVPGGASMNTVATKGFRAIGATLRS